MGDIRPPPPSQRKVAGDPISGRVNRDGTYRLMGCIFFSRGAVPSIREQQVGISSMVGTCQPGSDAFHQMGSSYRPREAPISFGWHILP